VLTACAWRHSPVSTLRIRIPQDAPAAPAPTDTRPRLALLAGDAALVAQIRSGDHEAYEQVFRAYYPPLRIFAERYLQSTDAAKDLVQDILCALWANRERLVVTTTLERYLHAAVRNGALNRLRHLNVEARATVRLLSDGQRTSLETIDDHDDETAERAQRLARAIARLSASRREVLLLRWQRGLSYAEIAALTGMTAKAVEVQLYRTLRTLRRLVLSPT
jgi:RNA polymerase sigma-70 factor (ECF subfamily)